MNVCASCSFKSGRGAIAVVGMGLLLALGGCGDTGGTGGDDGNGGDGGAGSGGGGGTGGGGTGGTVCPADGTCGDGCLDAGETEATCCTDAGCSVGVCDEVNLVCVDPWTLDCPTDGCSANQPWDCPATGLPSYDCGTCGCPGSQSCTHDLCYAPEVLAAERSTTSIPWDWPIEDYFPFLDWLPLQPAMSYAQFADEVDALLSEDARRVALIIGESHGSNLEQAVGIQLFRDVAADWNVIGLGIEDNGSPLLDPTTLADLGIVHHGVAGDMTNVSYCNDAAAWTGGIRNDTNGVYFQYTGSGHTSQATWDHPEHWSICTFPHSAECVTRGSGKPIVLILWDVRIFAVQTDRLLMWRAGNFYPDEAAVTAALDDAIDRWDAAFALQSYEPAFDATVHGVDLNVRIVPTANTEDAFVAFFPQPGRRAFFTEGFRGIWNTPELRAHFLANDIQPGNCSVTFNMIDPALDNLYYWCSGISITVETTDFTVTDHDPLPG